MVIVPHSPLRDTRSVDSSVRNHRSSLNTLFARVVAFQIYEDLWTEAFAIGDDPDVKALVPEGKPATGPPESGQSHHSFLVEQMRRIYEDLEGVNYACGQLCIVHESRKKVTQRSQCDMRFLDSVQDKNSGGDEDPAAGLFEEDEYVAAERE